MSIHDHLATVARVQDGDTVHVVVDCDFYVSITTEIRLALCNAREHNEPGGAEATAHLAGLLPPGALVTLTTIKPDKFAGRWDAHVTLPDGTDLVTQLVADHWAATWDGVGVKPKPPWPRPEDVPAP